LKVLTTVSAARGFRAASKGRVVLVPTMGALHEGHAELIRRARRIAGRRGAVVVSIFVNPTQFGPKEDFKRYPRPVHRDRELCRSLGVDAIFQPAPRGMYAADHSTWVQETAVARDLCGASRPVHFRGVCTVVLKLFTILHPSDAVFGLKDYQQCRVIARMVRDLDVPVRLHFAPTVRDHDGLALSSRNAFLSPVERAEAPSIRRGLLAACEAFRRGRRGAAALRKVMERHLSPMARLDYIGVVNGSSLEPVRTARPGDTIAVAAFFGPTRLIDNIQLR
jgi:pantoate--beta-alanine ligase